MTTTSVERVFRQGDIIDHPSFGQGRVIAIPTSSSKDFKTYRSDCVAVEFRSGLNTITKIFKRHILASILAGDGVPYRDRHPYDDELREVCVAPSVCDEPGHHGVYFLQKPAV